MKESVNNAETMPFFSARLARDEDLRAEALRIFDREDIQLIQVERPSANVVAFWEMLMREACGIVPRVG